MSFAIVSIAIDRVKTVYDLMAMRERGRMAPPKSKIRCIKVTSKDLHTPRINKNYRSLRLEFKDKLEDKICAR